MDNPNATEPTITIVRVTHMACDNCGEDEIRFRDPNTLYLDPRCAASVIHDDELWAEFADVSGPKSVVVPTRHVGL